MDGWGWRGVKLVAEEARGGGGGGGMGGDGGGAAKLSTQTIIGSRCKRYKLQ